MLVFDQIHGDYGCIGELAIDLSQIASIEGPFRHVRQGRSMAMSSRIDTPLSHVALGEAIEIEKD
jgi:hypothetical protein